MAARTSARRLLDVARERRERLPPEHPVTIDELSGRLEGLTDEVAVVIPAVALAAHQVGPLQDPEVLRNRREGHGERFSKLADRRRPSRQTGEDPPSRPIGERREDGVQRIVVGGRGLP